MKLIKSNSIIIWAGLVLAVLQYSLSADSLVVEPSLPAAGNDLKLSLFRSEIPDCSYFIKEEVRVEGSQIYLSHKVIKKSDDKKMGEWVSYRLDPLTRGKYDVILTEKICTQKSCEQETGPERIGGFFVYDDIYKLSRTGMECDGEPCRTFSTFNKESEKIQTVSAIKDLDEEFISPLVPPYIDWVDGDYCVRGYFKKVCMQNWRFRDTIFIVTDIIRPTEVASEMIRTFTPFYSIRWVNNGIEVKVGNDLIGTTLNLYDAQGVLKEQVPLTESRIFVPYFEEYSGMLFLGVDKNPQFGKLKVLVMR